MLCVCVLIINLKIFIFFSLGARHDGDRNICTPHDKYIMTSIGGDVTLHTRLNPFRFSECSKSYFLDRLQTL